MGHQFSKDVLRARRRNIFTASTLAAGVAHGTALSTTPPLALWNPTGSNQRLILVEAVLGYVSGALGAGSVVYGVVPQAAAPAGGAELVVQPAVLGDPLPAGIGRAFQGSTLSGVPTLIKPAFVLEAAPTKVQKDAIEGALSIRPGQALCLQGVAAAGTAPLVLLAMTWIAEKFDEV